MPSKLCSCVPVVVHSASVKRYLHSPKHSEYKCLRMCSMCEAPFPREGYRPTYVHHYIIDTATICTISLLIQEPITQAGHLLIRRVRPTPSQPGADLPDYQPQYPHHCPLPSLLPPQRDTAHTGTVRSPTQQVSYVVLEDRNWDPYTI